MHTPHDLDPDVTKAFGIDTMPAAEQNALFQQAGDVIIDASVGRLLIELSEDEVAEIEAVADKMDGDTELFSYLLHTYPRFATIVEEEISAVRAEAETAVVEPPGDTDEA